VSILNGQKILILPIYRSGVASMYTIKQMIARGVFLIELCALVILYLYGNHGLQNICKLERENTILTKETQRMAHEIDALEHEIAAWNHDSFYKEKVAREQLQMAYKGDEVYYIN